MVKIVLSTIDTAALQKAIAGSVDVTDSQIVGFILSRVVTRYDRAQENRRGHNRHALGIYLRAVDDCIARLTEGEKLPAALAATFNDKLLSFIEKSLGLPIT